MPKLADYFIQNRWPWLAASIILTALLFISTSLGWFWYTEQRATAERQLSLDLLWLEQSVAESLLIHKKILVNWANDLPPDTSARSSKATEEFLSNINGLVKENPAILSVDYLDTNGHRVLGYPIYLERPDHLPPVSDPLITEAVQRSLSLATPAYSQVIEQFAALWVLAIPIFIDGKNQGSLLATYDLNQLLSQKVPWWFVQRYDLSLVDRNDKQLSPKDGAISANADNVHKLAFGPLDSGLSLRATPHIREQSKILLGFLALAVVLLGLLVIWLLKILQRWLRERQAVQQVLAKELRFREAMEQSLVTGLLAFDLDGKIIYANPALCHLLGLAHENLLGSSAPFPFWPLDSKDVCQQAHQAMLQGENPANGRNLHFLHADGSLLSVRLFASPLVDGNSHPTGWMASLVDITAERQAANTARERDELLQHTSRLATLAEFASGIAHELNQPLAAIANYSAAADSFLDASPMQTQKVQEAVRRMGEESRRAGQIVHSMRSFIQRRTAQHETHRLSDLLTEPLALLEPMLQRSNITLKVTGLDQHILIDCDAVMIEQVLFNLIRNAIEAVATVVPKADEPALSEVIVLRIIPEADSVVVSVCDRGPGIADHDKLFQAFYTTKSEGMGLGLAICRTVIESHGGRLWADDNPDGGARFHFRIPCTALSSDDNFNQISRVATSHE